MKPSSLVIVPLLATGLAACQRQAEPARAAAAQPAPSTVAASVAPPSTPPGDEAPPSRSPRRDTPVHAPAQTPAQTPTPAPRVDAESHPAPARGPETLETEPRSLDATGPRPRDEEATVRRSGDPIVLPAGTELPIRLAETLASDTSRPEQEVLAELTDDVRANGRVALPAATEVIGHVVIAQQSGRVKGRARLVVSFDEIRLRHRSYPIQAWRWDVTAASSRDRDAKIAGGAAAAGAIIGAITGGGKGALKGGLLGGAAGGAAVLVTRGKEVELRSGAQHKITLRKTLQID
jgi:hypothetical protein